MIDDDVPTVSKL